MKIQKHILRATLISFLILFSSTSTFGENVQENVQEKYNPTPDILHHIQDSHEWHFWGKGDESVTIHLPIILYTSGEKSFFSTLSKKGHLDVFMSSEFHHGSSDFQKGDRIYSIDHDGNITEKEGGYIIDLSITKNVASMFISVLLLFLLLRKTASSYKNTKQAPKGIQAFLEPLVLFVRDDIIKSNIGPKHEKYTMFLLTVFFFILINNLTGLLPGSANVTGNISVTVVLSVFTLVITNFSGNKGYWKHIIKPPGAPAALLPIMIPVEIFGVFTKPFALMIRLFANITAGHIIILSLVSLIFVASNNGVNAGAGWSVAPLSVIFVLFIMMIELLVAFLQAYIFTLLSAVFIGLAVKEDH